MLVARCSESISFKIYKHLKRDKINLLNAASRKKIIVNDIFSENSSWYPLWFISSKFFSTIIHCLLILLDIFFTGKIIKIH